MNTKLILVVILLVLTKHSLQAQSGQDSVFIYSAKPISVAVDNKILANKKVGVIAFLNPGGKQVSIGSPKGVFLVDPQIIQSGQVLVLADTAWKYTFFKVEPIAQSGAAILSTREVRQFLKVAASPKADELLEFMTMYKTGSLNIEAHRMLNELITETVGDQTKSLERQNNLTLAGDLAISLPSADQDAEIKKVKIRLADYYLKQSKASSASGRLATAIEAAQRSNSLYPKEGTAKLLDSLKQALARENVSTEILAADSLMKKGQRFLALMHYRIALDRDPGNEYLKTRIDRLDNNLQDSLFQYAKQKDVKSELVLYRSMNYLNYLDRYPNGKYVEVSNQRLAKLERTAKQLSRYFVLVGQNYSNIKGEGPAYSLKLGKFTERSIVFFGARMNQAGLEFKSTKHLVDKKNVIGSAQSLYAYATAETGKSRYLSRGAVFLGVSKGVGKPGNFQFFLTGAVGHSWANYWILTYKSPSSIQFVPEAKPAFRKYKSPQNAYSSEFGLLINYKMFCLDMYWGVASGNLSGGYSVGLSF